MPDDVIVTAEELKSRTILREQLVADKNAFIDTKIPGSENKINYPLIGPGVSENAEQVVPVTAPHGFNLGAAAMPAGVTNNLHLHFTAEVFMCIAGDWQFRWGVNGDDGEVVVRPGDVISIPTWVFRGFTSVGEDDAFLFTALGRDESGGLIWAPSVLEKAARYGLHLGADNTLIETAPGEFPTGVELKKPLTEEQLGRLRRISTEEMRERLARPDDLSWSHEPFLDSRLPGGGADLATVVGYGITEDRNQAPRVADPHGFSLAWLRAERGSGMSTHRHGESQVLIVKSGRWRVTLNREDPVAVEIGPYDTLSIPVGAWRRFESIGDETGQVVLLTGGEGRTRLEWDPVVVAEARTKDAVIDANGYVADASLIFG
jgi:mannose-6-phosphate isomerase-like protein (cupin superfamily)